MKKSWLTIAVVLALAVVVGVVIAGKDNGKSEDLASVPDVASEVVASPPEASSERAVARLPRLVELGATKCVPCKMMAPILEELEKECKGKLEVQFIDVWENQKAGQEYRIRSIPTQIFYDAKGEEFFRHVGFFAKEDILAKFKEHGIVLAK